MSLVAIGHRRNRHARPHGKKWFSEEYCESARQMRLYEFLGFDAGKCVPLILIVNDSLETAGILARLLSQRGIASVMMSGSNESFGYLGSDDRSDLVILDMMMPVMDGLDCLSAIRSNPMWKDIPVIMYCADSNADQMAAAHRLGAQQYLDKSSSWEEFLGTIRRYASSA